MSKFKIGDKVVPISKSLGVKFRDSIWFEKLTPFLICAADRGNYLVCTHQDEDVADGDHFLESDLIPYVEESKAIVYRQYETDIECMVLNGGDAIYIFSNHKEFDGKRAPEWPADAKDYRYSYYCTAETIKAVVQQYKLTPIENKQSKTNTMKTCKRCVIYGSPTLLKAAEAEMLSKYPQIVLVPALKFEKNSSYLRVFNHFQYDMDCGATSPNEYGFGSGQPHTSSEPPIFALPQDWDAMIKHFDEPFVEVDPDAPEYKVGEVLVFVSEGKQSFLVMVTDEGTKHVFHATVIHKFANVSSWRVGDTDNHFSKYSQQDPHHFKKFHGSISF